MSLIKTTDATVEPVTLQQAKLHLRVIADLADVSAHPEDTLIAALITTARSTCEARIGRSLLQTTWTLQADAFPCDVFRLERGPIMSVDSIQYVDTDGALQTLPPSAYRLSGHRVQTVDRWPNTQRQIGAVTVVYKAGYGTTPTQVPAPLVSWIKLALGDLYDNRARSSERPALPQQFADGLLEPYMVWAV